MGDQAGQTKDDVTRDVMHSGTNVVYAGGKVSRGTLTVNDNASKADIEKIVEILKENKAKKVTRMIGASGKINTSPVNAAFV